MKRNEKIFNEIDSLEAKYIDFWKDLCNVESPTEYKAGVDKVGHLIFKEAQALGFETELIPQEKAGDLVKIMLNNNSDKKPIILSAHIDTVHSVGSFGTPAVKIADGKIYGPGVLDDKGGAAASIYAMHTLKNCGYTDRNIIFIAQTDEEVGSVLSDYATINYIIDEAKKCEVFMNCEPWHKGEAILQRKGIANYRFEIKGKAAHAAKCFLGANALLEASHKIIDIEKYKDKASITCSCSLISGGKVLNSVPDECVFYADVRYFTEEQYKEIDKKLRKIAEKSYIGDTSCEISCISRRPPMELTERNIQFMDKINKIYELVGFEPLKQSCSFGGSDAANVSAAGVTVVESIGCEGKYEHSFNEFAYLSSLKESAQRIANIIYFYDKI